MAWNYTPGRDPIRHKAGDVPPRPLEVGDEVFWDSGWLPDIIVATAESLLMFSRRTMPMHRRPIEGDDSRSIFAKEE